MPVAVFTSGSRSLAMPKSMIFTRPSESTMMLPGFTSRWTTPRSWATASASATRAAISTASEGASEPPRMRSRSSRPSSSSIAMKATSPSRPTS